MDSDANIRYMSHKSWYGTTGSTLYNKLSNLLSTATKSEKADNLKSIIVPHAGYYYCAETASYAFTNINPDNYDKIFILGPSHHYPFVGVGLTPFETYQTPFGNFDVDTEIIKKLNNSHKLFNILDDEVDLDEHSLEMELPFLKSIFGDKDVKIVPLMIGSTNLEMNYKIAEYLQPYFNDSKSLFVISSDFAHWGRNFGFMYYDKSKGNIWESTEYLDKLAMSIIGRLNPKELDEYFKKYHNTICGRSPISIVLCNIEKYKDLYKDKNISFDLAHYSQSNKVMNLEDTSVSYAAGINFIQ